MDHPILEAWSILNREFTRIPISYNIDNKRLIIYSWKNTSYYSIGRGNSLIDYLFVIASFLYQKLKLQNPLAMRANEKMCTNDDN